MEKRLLSFLIYSMLATFVCACWQCKSETDPRTREVKEYLKANYDVGLGADINRIYVINDQGCANCVLSLSEFVKQHVDDDRALIILNSRGASVDLDVFESKKQKNPNIVINHRVITDKNNMFYNSGVVYIRQEKVDTVVYIFGEGVVEQLQYIFAREKQYK